ncbi:MAG: NADH-quinone oxidoreductase subunit C [Candidatus Omnitrophica bacterium]|nr:NADH-quinone oxidoreductase subunit C [Candidatus Omnitrophota bacterium]
MRSGANTQSPSLASRDWCHGLTLMSFAQIEELKAAIERDLPDLTLQVEGSTLIVEAKDLLRVCRFLKDAPAYEMDDLSNLTAIDYPAAGGAGPPGHIDVVYHLYSMRQKHGPIALRVKLPRDNPVVGSVTPLWRGAEFQEREAYDLFGVIFEGHPDLRRILMWEGFKGHPMRKDYVVEEQ